MGLFSLIPIRINGTQVDAGWWNLLRLAGIGSDNDIAAIIAEKGVPNGIATTDSSGKIPSSQLPASVFGALNFQGTLDASGGAYPSSPAKGYYWVVNVAGTISGLSYNIGDWATYDGTTWDKVDNNQLVSSVAGRTGIVVLTKSDVGLSSVDNTSDATKNSAVANLSNKTFSDAPTFTEISTPSNPSTGLMKFYPKSDGKFYTLDPSGTETAVGSGAGSGGTKNYLSNYLGNTGNGDFELNSTTGWSKFTTTLTSLIPTGSISAGASSITSFGIASGTKLANQYSLSVAAASGLSAGQGFISDAFTIDLEDQAKVMTVKAYYSVVNGTMNFSGTSSNTWALYVYDVTNSVWIQPAGVYGMTQGSGVGYVTATFQTTSNSTQYRLAVLCINATTGLTSMLFDDFSIGPQTTPIGPAVGDTISFTPTITTATGTPTNYTATGNYQRIGDRAFIKMQVLFTGAPGTFTKIGANMPSGLSIDTTKMPGATADVSILGDGAVVSGNSGVNPVLKVAYSSATAVVFKRTITSGASGSNPDNLDYANNIGSGDIASGAQFTLLFDAPIVGWSSNVQMSSDTDTRLVSFRGTQSSQSVTADVTDIAFTATKDSHATWNGTQYKIPVSGDYLFVANMTNSGGAFNPEAYVDGVLYEIGSSIPAGYKAPCVVLLTGMKAGQLVSCRVNVSGTISQGALALYKLSGPAVVAATESVNGLYTDTSGTAIATSVTAYTFPTKVKDSHNAYSGGVLTIPVSGMYRFVAQFLTNGVTISTSNVIQMYIFRNGTQIGGVNLPGCGATNNYTPIVSVSYPCLAGDQITIKTLSNVATTANTAAGWNNFSWERVGN